ncbi:54S ribosomal protein L7, mitochondrial [Zancudomyces culisetae]|uniref:Large ribosomal subunit protein uL5m n=1 Tax=Zancudomyces culisetae TaxID=1213189 RepID=A0A1R1PSI9_ZANCU|nr:54S ribosomal protein L7, mitochondrial [Zancudomyces culisetae]|eukprot:OMH83914.1 54S ribosomal protein L7, mitochondrial [Zancudomyces culisetae]
MFSGLRSSVSILGRAGASKKLNLSHFRANYTRLSDFYDITLRDDLMILNYEHKSSKLDEYREKNVPVVTRNPEKRLNKKEDELVLEKNKARVPEIKPINAENVPRLEKITVQIRMKEGLASKSNILSGLMALQCITGETPDVIHARSDAATWKLRKGMPIGAKVVLQGDAMYEFMDKLVEVVLPRLKEWDGLKTRAGDGLGNFTLGFSPSALGLFPEIEGIYDMFPVIYGFYVNIGTTANRNIDGRMLLSGFKIPFVKPRTRIPPRISRRRKQELEGK